MSNFPFLSNNTLRSNLDVAFDHVVDLTALSETEQYRGKGVLLSSLRKTIIIHIAAIIEALLLWKLKQISSSERIELPDDWIYSDIRILHTKEDSTEVVAGLRRKERKEIDRLDFIKTTELCYKHKIIKRKKLKEDIDQVRLFRNNQHIGGLAEIEKEYKSSDLEFCFNVAERVRRIASG